MKSKGPGGETGIKNPILLVTADPNNTVKPDKEGRFLKGAYIGTATHDANDHIVINAQAYDAANETFVPYDAANIMLPNVAVYPTQVRDPNSPSAGYDQLIAFDPTGENLVRNGDGSFITPGLELGMK